MSEYLSFIPEEYRPADAGDKKKEKWKRVAGKSAVWASVGLASLGAGYTGKLIYEGYAGQQPEHFIAYAEHDHKFSEAQKQQTLKRLEFLKAHFSGHIIQHLEFGDRGAHSFKETVPKPLEVSGFEDLGFGSGDLQKLWTEPNYPAGTVTGNVDSVRYREIPKGTGQYGFPHMLSGEATVGEHNITLSAYPEEDRKQIPRRQLLEGLDWTYAHELGHENDWVGARDLTAEQRVEFLEEVARAFGHPGSFREPTGYVEQVTDPDKQKEAYYKVVEWWGTLSEYYFSAPDLLKQQNPQDYELAKKWLTRRAAGFDAEKAQQARQKIIAEMAGEGDDNPDSRKIKN